MIVTYDPFQSGAIGVVAKFLSAGALICEINGDFSNSHSFQTAQGLDRSSLARRVRLATGAAVLRLANSIRCLFSGQARPFGVRDTDFRCWQLFDLVDEATFTTGGDFEAGEQLIFVGHPFHLKGGDILLNAFDRISSRHPTWRLVMVGHRVEEHARRSGAPIGAHVSFLGPQPPNELAQLIRGSRALILPSRTEAMGRVLLEAAFAGRARIASRVGGTSTVIHHGEDGLLFTSESSDSLEQTLERFIGDSQLQRRLGAAAVARAWREFTSTVYVAAYENAIDKAIRR